MGHRWQMNEYFSSAASPAPQQQKGRGGGSCKKNLVPIPGLAKQPQAPAINSVESEIISCSRRTDVPAFHMKWLLQRVQEGFVDITYGKEIQRVVLKPGPVRAFVWWSKDYAPWLEAWHSPESGPMLRQFDAHCFNFTINSPSILEPGIRHSIDERLAQMTELARIFGPESLVLRFDPIVFYKIKGDNTRHDNLSHFQQICAAAGSAGVKSIAFAFCIPYKTVVPRMEQEGIELIEISLVEKRNILSGLVKTARDFGVKLNACCGSDLLGYLEIQSSKCVNGEQVNGLLQKQSKPLLHVSEKDQRQRADCTCTKSYDIGSFSVEFACGHRCLYCYANPLNRNVTHNPEPSQELY